MVFLWRKDLGNGRRRTLNVSEKFQIRGDTRDKREKNGREREISLEEKRGNL